MTDLPPRRADGFFQDLFAHQKYAIEEIEKLLEHSPRVLLVSPTASGKGTVSVEMAMQAAARGEDFVFCAHRAELAIDQADRLRAAGVERVDVIVASRESRDPSAKIHVGTYQSMANRVLPRCDRFVGDEAHRILARGQQEVIRQLAPRHIIGMTGSPRRTDRQPLSKFFDAMVIAAQPKELVALGRLAAAKVFAPRDSDVVDVSNVKMRGDDFDPAQLAAAAGKKHLVGAIVDHWKRRASDLLTVAFCAGLHNAQALADEFNAAGVPAMRVDGEMGTDQRQLVLAKMASGEIRIAVTADVWLEGVDLPALKCAILARPTLSLTVYLQAVGRVFRVYHGLNAVILDHAGNTKRHGLPQMDRPWSIEPELRTTRKGPDAPRSKTCPGLEGACGAELAVAVRLCPECGHAFGHSGVIDVIEGELVEVTHGIVAKAATDGAKRAAFIRFWLAAYKDDHDAAWVARRYVDRFGEPPPDDWTPPERPHVVYTAAQKRSRLVELMGIAQRNAHPRAWVAEQYRAKFGEDPSALEAVPAETVAETPKPVEPVITNVELEF